MKKTPFFLSLSLLIAFSHIAAQQNPFEIKLKIAETSGLFGMSGPKFIRLTLSTKNREKALTSENVNSGNYYYFLLQNEGKWQIDADFLKEDLAKLSLTQKEERLHPEFTGDIIANGESTFVLIGFRKTFGLHKPFSIEYPSGDAVAKAEMNIPQEDWPGYSKVTYFFYAGDKALKDLQYKTAVLNFNAILSDQSLAIFPLYATAKEKRLESFDKYFAENYDAFSKTMISNGDVKQKIGTATESIGKFQFVVDSLADQSIGVSAADRSIVPLMEKSRSALQRSRVMLDSLHHALDDFNVRWIIAGSSGGRIDFKYKYMVEALAYAFTSVNFGDSTAKELVVILPEELSARLKKYNLTESYETFVRISTERWKKKSTLFPPEFLTNLVKDSLQFPLPYYSVLKAVNYFYSSSYAETKKEVIRVMKKSYDHELTGRMDDLRVIIETREKKIPGEVLAHMTEGRLAEEKGNTDGAAEHYKDAMLISEEYAPAAFALGKLYDRIGDSYKANNFFQKAVTSDTIYYSAYRFLYINYFKNSNFKPMIDLLTQALARGNDFYDIHYYLGIAYNGAALYEEAIKQYERGLELNAKSIDANIQAGIAYQNMKSYAKAREYYTRAIQIDPENQTATENLKRLDELQKKF
jgi:tetratricopeptide (TPR) repeat protein